MKIRYLLTYYKIHHPKVGKDQPILSPKILSSQKSHPKRTNIKNNNNRTTQILTNN